MKSHLNVVAGFFFLLPPAVVILILLSLKAEAASEIFSVQYLSNENGCNGGNAVVMKGYATNETYAVKVFNSSYDTGVLDMTCAEQAICLVNEDSSSCDADQTATNGPFFAESESGLVYSEWNGQKTLYGPNNCTAGGWYPSCGFFNYATIDDLKSDPSKFLTNSDPEVIEDQLSSFLYAAFYEDDECTELTAVQTIVSGDNYTLLGMSDSGGKQYDDSSISCNELSACLIDVESSACKATGAKFYINTTEYILSTTTDVNGTPAVLIGPNLYSPKCAQSDIIPTCYYNIFAAGYLAIYPNAINGVFPDDDDNNSDAESTLPDDNSSDSSVAVSRMTLSIFGIATTVLTVLVGIKINL